MTKLLIVMLDKALSMKGESREDLTFISHPIELIEEEPTLEAIQCMYLNSTYGWHIYDSVDKQDMPFAATTEKHLYHFGEYGYNGGQLHCFQRGTIENLDDEWMHSLGQCFNHSKDSLDDIIFAIDPIKNGEVDKDLFIAVSPNYWYYYGPESIGEYNDIRCFRRDDLGGSKRWTPEYHEYVSKMAKITMLEFDLIRKSSDRKRTNKNIDATEAILMKFNCYVKHPETNKKVLVKASVKGIDCLSCIDKNGIDLLKIYDHLKVDS